MSGGLSVLDTDLRAQGWALTTAIPRDREHALLQLRDPDGSSVAGQWFADPERASRVARATAGASRDAVERPLPLVLAQRGGADRRLAGLADRCAGPGVALRAHRPERRAVIEVTTGTHRFVKIVRPERMTAALQRAMTVRVDGVATPRVLDLDPSAGTVTTAALAGTTLHEAIRAADLDIPERLGAVGETLARLHRAPVPQSTGRHDAGAEIAVVDRWFELARQHGMPLATWRRADEARDRLARQLPGRAAGALLHRDLHDKQLVLGRDGIGLLDLDLLAVGDAALDLANLVVHLELRARQGLLPLAALPGLVDALVSGYRPDPDTRDAATGYLLATRLRLVAVYAFRPASAAAAALLLTEPVVTELT